ncbi:MFS transporter [Alkalinema sp. FACHB-956]|uniref:MFS transporter n=1 Tax=Alkalinema sp. FACHB-956 TaxID=2692768 RepID=UPI0016860E1D|nr:MFS transporter [Alkalinema sp. FACHB-956]MBD2328801.1 MFS transporter [Alkalinema sp. FACHB-956]
MALSRSSLVAWKSVFGLAAVQGAITLTWVIYNLYVPNLLEQVGLPKIVGLYLLAFENFLAIGLEPLMGSLSDRQRTWLGVRFPFVFLGMIAAAVCFIAIPAWAFLGSATTVLQWLVPIGLLAWAIAMAIFRSPVLGLLGQYAMTSGLPQAASILTLAGLISGLFTLPAYRKILLNLGPLGAFGLGSLSLLLTAFVLNQAQPETQVNPAEIAGSSHRSMSYKRLGLLVAVGLGLGLGTVGMRRVIQPSPDSVFLLNLFTLTQLISVLPTGYLASRWGNRRSMVLALATIPLWIAGLLIPYLGIQVLSVIALGCVFGVLLNGAIPFALAQVPVAKAGLGVGLYFAGRSAADSLFNFLLAQIGSFPTEINAIGSILAFAGAGFCILLTRDRRNLGSAES